MTQIFQCVVHVLFTIVNIVHRWERLSVRPRNQTKGVNEQDCLQVSCEGLGCKTSIQNMGRDNTTGGLGSRVTTYTDQGRVLFRGLSTPSVYYTVLYPEVLWNQGTL